MLTPFQLRARNALADCPVFGELSDSSLRCMIRASLRKGDTLFERGEASDSLYGVVSGRAKLYAEHASGRQISFGLVGPGELIGELGISSDEPRHASVVALAHCELARIRRDDLERLVERHPDLHAALSRASAAAALRLSQRIEDAALLSIEDQVERALVDCARRFGERIEDGVSVSLRQQDLADLIGASRESVSRVLTSTSIRERVRLGRGRIVILDAGTR